MPYSQPIRVSNTRPNSNQNNFLTAGPNAIIFSGYIFGFIYYTLAKYYVNWVVLAKDISVHIWDITYYPITVSTMLIKSAQLSCER